MKKKKEAFSRRVLVLEDAAAANTPSKLSNPFLDQFGAKKVKAPETLWASPKEKVGKILHLKKGETQKLTYRFHIAPSDDTGSAL